MPIIWGNTIISFPIWTPALTLGYVAGYFFYSIISKTSVSLLHLSIAAAIGIVLTTLSIRWFRKKDSAVYCSSLLKSIKLPLGKTIIGIKLDAQCILADMGLRIVPDWNTRKVVLTDVSQTQSFLIGMTSHPMGTRKFANVFHQFFNVTIPPELKREQEAATKIWKIQWISSIAFAIVFAIIVLLVGKYL